jgi:cyclic pyranopterin phosphate synthase
VTSTIHHIRTPRNPLDRLGRPLHDLRISVMDRCNFRCPYCMPKEQFHEHYRFLKSQERLSFEEITRLAGLFAGLGVSKLRLTGGEPLLRTNLADLVGDLTEVPGIDDIALTTNGVLLGQHAVDLHANGLKRVTVSLDTPDREIFSRMSGGFAALDQVLAGIDAAIAAGLTPVKINAVIERGLNDHTALDLVERFRGSPVIVRFIEFMDVGSRNNWRPELVVPSRELAARIHERWPMQPIRQNYPGEVAQRWRFDDGGGEVGFIFGLAALLRSLQPGAPLLGGQVLHLPVRDPWPRSARAAARRRRRCRNSAIGPRRVERPDRPLQRAARGIAARGADGEEDRNELHRRLISMTFTHLDTNLHPTMVDVGDKRPTKRTATAEARVRFPSAVAAALRDSGLRSAKGPIFDTAIVAGIMGAKRTHELIPFCHPLGIENCRITIDLDGDAAVIRCTVSVHHKTGVEMEALTGASIAALTIYDMCKALSRHRHRRLRLLAKEGGRAATT